MKAPSGQFPPPHASTSVDRQVDTAVETSYRLEVDPNESAIESEYPWRFEQTFLGSILH